jgi:hypothetical protein
MGSYLAGFWGWVPTVRPAFGESTRSRYYVAELRRIDRPPLLDEVERRSPVARVSTFLRRI